MADKLLRLNLLVGQAQGTKFEQSEGNIESLFASRLLTEVVGIPLDWLFHQYPIHGGFADIAVVTNDTPVLIVECKRARASLTREKSAIEVRKALHQGLGYGLTEGVPLVMVTNGHFLTLIDHQEITINSFNPESIIKDGRALIKSLEPKRLYYRSRGFHLPSESIKLRKFMSAVESLQIVDESEISLEEFRDEFVHNDEWNAFETEVSSWISLAQHYRRSSVAERRPQNFVIHIDHSLVSYFSGSWYYDNLHAEVTHRESEITRQSPGTTIRVFILRDRQQLMNEYERLLNVIHNQLILDCRCGLMYNRDWLASGVARSHVDIVGTKYAKIYDDRDKIIAGTVVSEPREVQTLRDDVLSVVATHAKIFEPRSLDPFTLDRVEEYLRAEVAKSP